MNNLMIDCETLSLAPDALILSIGACYFNAEGVGDCFYERIDFDLRYGDVDKATLMWWMKQDQAIRDETFSGKLYLEQVLIRFAAFAKFDVRCWSKHMIDFVWLKSAYGQCGMRYPLNYKLSFDYATMEMLAPSAHNKLNNHCALDDAINQASRLIEIHKVIPCL